MSSLATELKQLIATRLERASVSEILAITSQLAANEAAAPAEPVFGGGIGGGRFAPVEGTMVADNGTRLLWSRSTLPGGKMNWEKAKEACAALELGGFKDWRLPTVRELLGLVAYSRHNPSIDEAFECESDWYWTATPAACSPAGDAWIVVFNDGNSNWDHHSGEVFVRAVRSSQ